MFYGAIGYPEKSGARVREDEGEQAGFYKFEFMDFGGEGQGEGEGEVKEVKEVKCEVVIVGSGCGGAVVAAKLAKEGFDVVVVDRGIWYASPTSPLRRAELTWDIAHQGSLRRTPAPRSRRLCQTLPRWTGRRNRGPVSGDHRR